MCMEIITNHVPREIIDGWELTAKEREEFDYLNWPAIQEGNDSASFFRYRGELYDLGEFLRVENSPMLSDWSGYSSDSFFSGTLVKYVTKDHDQMVVVGRYYS